MGILVATFAAYAYSAANEGNKLLASIAAGGIALAQPIFLELVTWPFMALQMVCCACAVASAIALILLLETERTKFLWWHLGLAYASMHFSGVGLGFAVAALVVSFALAVVDRRLPRLPIVVFALLTLLHAMMMATDTKTAGLMNLDFVDAVTKFGIGYWSLVTTGLETVLGFSLLYIPNINLLPVYATFGITALTMISLTLAASLSTRPPSAIYLLSYALIASVVYAALATIRPGHGNQDLLGYFFGTRYIIFTFTITMLFAGGLLRLVRTKSAPINCMLIVLLWAAVFRHANFVAGEAHEIWPARFVSHRLIWQSVIDETRSALQDGRPIVNKKLPTLGEFGFEARRYEALIRRTIGIPADTNLVWTQ